MGLFYTHDRTGAATRPRVKIGFDLMAKMGCRACPLDGAAKYLSHPKMLPTGSVAPHIYVLGEAPGSNEDAEGRQFIGRSGMVIRDSLRTVLDVAKGVKGAEDKWVRWNNVIRCHPEKNRDPEEKEIICCMPKQWRDIAASKPRVVLSLGKPALHALLSESQISAWRGRKISMEYDGHKFWLVPTYHPSFIMRVSGGDGATKSDRQQRDLKKVFEADVAFAVALADENKPPQNILSKDKVHEGLTQLMAVDSIVSTLNRLNWPAFAATDIETTALRPYHDGSAILSASISNGKQTYVFPIAHPQAQFSLAEQTQILKAYKEALLRCRIIFAHNSNFEMEWLNWKFGPELVSNLDVHDTMAQAYVLDERSGALALNDLCCIHLGIKIKDLVELDKANLREEPLSRVLPYNGLDSKACSLVARIQAELLEEASMTGVYDMMRQRSVPIAIMQNLGMVPDTDEAERLHDKYKQEIADVKKAIMADPDVVNYVKKSELNLTAPKSVSAFFTANGSKHLNLGGRAGEEQLKEIDHPVAGQIMTMREYAKLDSTYIVPFLAEIERDGKLIRRRGKHVYDDGLVHTQFNHLLTSTGRLCVARGAMITTHIGGNKCLVPIELIKPLHHHVPSFTNDLELATRQVLSKEKTGKKKCVQLVVNRFGKEHIVIVTPDHRIRVSSGNNYASSYMAADLLRPGMQVIVEPNVRASVLKRPSLGTVMAIRDAGWHEVYDLEIQIDKNFFANGICVHNSSQDPNLQNLPIREHPEVRGLLKVVAEVLGIESWIVSFDMGQIEARVIGMASRDRNFCQALREDFDVHADWALRIAHEVPRCVGGKAAIKDKDVMKKFRSKVKNAWVFPAFYKAGLSSISASFGCEEDELRGLFEDFWLEFAGVHKWQKELLKFYGEYGYVETLTGRRRHGPMTPNMAVNSPIQGTASDLVVDAMCRLSRLAVSSDRMYLHPRVNIHDDLTGYIPDDKLEESIDIIAKEMVTYDFDFTKDIPLTVEVKIGKSFGAMKEIAVMRTEDYA